MFQWHELLDSDKTEEPLDNLSVSGQRLPGLIFNQYENSAMKESAVHASAQWMNEEHAYPITKAELQVTAKRVLEMVLKLAE